VPQDGCPTRRRSPSRPCILHRRAEALLEIQAFFTTYMVRAAFAEPDALALMIDFWLGSTGIPQPRHREKCR
jgi:hypothetical protein